jgi:hypothetical protein
MSPPIAARDADGALESPILRLGRALDGRVYFAGAMGSNAGEQEHT